MVTSFAALLAAVITFGPGVHETDGLELKSGDTLVLEEGARLVGTTNVKKAVVWATNATHIAIRGKGVIDGNGAAFDRVISPLPNLKLSGRSWNTVKFVGCTDVTVEDVRLEGATGWTFPIADCNGVTIRGITMFSHANFNNDGIDISSRNVLIENCDIDAEDDSIVCKAKNPDTVVSNVVVRNCRLSSNSSLIKFGTESKGLVKDVLVENCDIACRTPIRIRGDHLRMPGARGIHNAIGGIEVLVVDGGTLENVTVRNITMGRGITVPVFVRGGTRNRQEGRPTYLRNVLIENVKMIEPSESIVASSITGVEGIRPENITLRNVELLYKGGASFADVDAPREGERTYPSPHATFLSALPAYGFFVRHADGVRFENVKLKVADESEERPAFVIEDASVSRVNVTAFESAQCAASEKRLFNVTDFTDLAAALAAARQAGGGCVLVPEGEWSSGPIELTGGIELRLHPLARLIRKDGTRPFISAGGAKNVSVSGRGIIVGSDDAKTPLLDFTNCTGLSLRDLRFERTRRSDIRLRDCSEVDVRRLLFVDAPQFGIDGLDIAKTKRCTVRDVDNGTPRDASGRFPRDFPITAFGAKPDGTKCTTAFAQAIDAASKCNGRVYVPAGEWFTDSIRLASNMELHLDDKAVVRFESDPSKYELVKSTYEGNEGYGRCSPVYAYGCTNLAITGGGTFTIDQHPWRRLQIQESKDHSLLEGGDEKLKWRPHMVQINRCKNIRLENFKIRYSPFWLVEILLSEDVVVRGLDTFGMWGNSDGIDIESSRRVLVENCTLDQNDDAFVIKSGRDAFGRQRGVPTQDVEIRNCHVRHAGGLVTIGSEISGGARNINIHDITADCVRNVFVLRSWCTRGGKVEHIRFADVDVDHCEQRFFATRHGWPVPTNVPPAEVFWTAYDDIAVERVHVREAKNAILASASPEMPFRNIRVSECSIDRIGSPVSQIENCIDCDFSGLKIGAVMGHERRDHELILPGEKFIGDTNRIRVVFCETTSAAVAESVARAAKGETVHLGSKWTPELAAALRAKGLKTARWADELVDNRDPDEIAEIAVSVPRDVELWYRDAETGVKKRDVRRWDAMRQLVRHGWPVVLVPGAEGKDFARNVEGLRREVKSVPLLHAVGFLSPNAKSAALSPRRTICLDGLDWSCDGGPVSLPHTWNAEDGADGDVAHPEAHHNPADSIGLDTYLKKRAEYSVRLPQVKKDRRYFLRFDGVSEKAEVFVNGRAIGTHRGAFTAFCFEITSALDFGDSARNELKVYADNRFDPEVPPFHADFSLQGGIYRSVWMIETDRICIDPTYLGGTGVKISADCESGEVIARVSVLGGTNEVHRFTFENPELWCPENPRMYAVEVAIDQNGCRDSITVPFAFREVEFGKDGFFCLNGKKVFLKGVNRHQDFDGSGWAVSEAQDRRDIALIKAMGANAVRTTHYPQSDRFYSLCDEAGLLCWCELPAVNAVTNTPAYRANLMQGVREMVEQLDAHPSVAMWSVFNEMYHGPCADGVAEQLLKEARDLFKSLDSSRPVVAASNQYKRHLDLNAIPEALAFNIYPGWYDKRLNWFAPQVKECLAFNPRSAVGVSEYGAGGSPNHHGDVFTRCEPRSRFHTEEWQTCVLAECLCGMKTCDRLWGAFLWVFADFPADARCEGEKAGINDKGLVTRDRGTLKDAYYLYQANWTDKPVCRIVGNRRGKWKGGKTNVMAISNRGPVTLLVNGVPYGAAQMPDEVKTVVWREVELPEGENALSLKVRPEISWSVMHPTAIDTNYMKRVVAKAVAYGNVDSFEVCGDCHSGSSGINGLSLLERYPHAHAKVDIAKVEKNRREMNALCEIAHAAGKPVYYWHREIFIPEGLLEDLPQLLDEDSEFDLLGDAYRDWIRYKLDETFKHCPGLDGIVLTLTEADYSVIHNSNPKRYPPQKVVEHLVGLFAEEHEKRGKRFILRSFGSNAQDYIDIIGGATRAAEKHAFEIETKVTEADFVPWLPKNPFLKKNPPLTLGAECDALGEYLGAGYLPAAQVARIREYVDSGRAEGVDRYTIRIDRIGNSIFDSAHEVNLYAYMRFIDDPSATVDKVVAEYAQKHFGEAAAEMIPLVKEELEMVRNIHYVASNLVFHAFPLKSDFRTVKAGGVFSVYREKASLASAKDIWSILDWMNTPSHAQILAEKTKGLAMAEEALSRIEALKDKMPADEYVRQHRAFSTAIKAAKALQAFAKCCVAYFEEMAARKDDPVRLRTESEAAVKLIESMMTNPSEDFTGLAAAFVVVGENLDRVYFAGLRYCCRELLHEYACERNLRRRYEARPEVIDFVTVGGIYDDNRTIRTMHGAHARIVGDVVVRQAGNPVFPNGTITVRFPETADAKVEVELDPSGTQECAVSETVKDGFRIVTVGKKGRDYPVVRSIALVKTK